MNAAAHIAAMHRAAAARRQIVSTAELPALPEPTGPVIITVTPTELWCSWCGSDGANHQRESIYNRNDQPACWRCGRHTMVRAVEVLERRGVAYALR